MADFQDQPDMSAQPGVPQPSPNLAALPPGVHDHPTDPNKVVIKSADGTTSVAPKSAFQLPQALVPSANTNLQPGLTNPQNQSQGVQPVAPGEIPPNPPVAQMAQPAPVAPQPPMALQAKKETQTATEQKKFRPEDERKAHEATAALVDSVKAQATAAIAQAENQAAMLDAHTAELQDQSAKMQANEAARQAKTQQYQSDLDKVTREYSGLEVDPNHYFGSMSTGNKIMAGVALAMGAIGAGMGNTGRNVALDVVEKAIDRDIDAQKANIATKGRAVELKRGAYSDYLQAAGNERAAELAEKNRQLEIFKNRLDAQAQASQSPIIQANAQNTIAQIQQKQAENDAEKHAILQKKADMASSEVAPAKHAGIEPKALTGEQAKELADAQESIATKERLRQKFDKMKSEIGPAVGRFKKAMAAAGLNPGADFVTLDKDSKLAAIKAAKQMFPGRLSDQEVNMALEIMPTVVDRPELAVARLDEMIKNDKEGLARRSSAYDTARVGGSISAPAPSANDIEAKYSK